MYTSNGAIEMMWICLKFGVCVFCAVCCGWFFDAIVCVYFGVVVYCGFLSLVSLSRSAVLMRMCARCSQYRVACLLFGGSKFANSPSINVYRDVVRLLTLSHSKNQTNAPSLSHV